MARESWADVLAFSLGELGLRPAEFWELTYSEYLCMADGYHHRRVLAWQETRWLGALLVNINRAPDTPAVEPSELLPLPGDAPAAPLMSTEELDAELARLAELDKDWL
ncbi:phage tail assembly chaperone [Microvirga sp. STS02]|uniref:phage tail assembly chaperone n=1 Tax=Hymenobacter negativus TaxID=2795026 RepID=UPI0018DCAE30|nr:MULTISPECIES: phage tail assembly chaperone [Bacteria]MBH8569354.1 phage tail assembly chaperone [Hymenobacter negativus]MBR7209088.1 phage tail assembly chaperone [Microvirga sp. STS02]